MLFAFWLLDKPDAIELRTSIRPVHKEYLAKIADKMAFAGPLTKDDGVSMIGSLLVADFNSREEAHGWLANEPFTKAGLYASISIQAFDNLWPQKVGFPKSA